MVDFVDELYGELSNHLNLLISGKYTDEDTSERRSKICKLISLMHDPGAKDTEVVFLRGLTLAFFIDSAMVGLSSLNQLLNDKQIDIERLSEFLNAVKDLSLQDYKIASLSDSQLFPFAHITRVERPLTLYNLWKKG